MPTHKQGTVEPVITTRDLGRSATNDLKSMFATSPVNLGDMSADSIKEHFSSIFMQPDCWFAFKETDEICVVISIILKI